MMEKSILQKLYDGEIYPSENIRESDNPEYRRIRAALAAEKEQFLKTLSTESCEHFNKITELHDELAIPCSYEGFAHGFKLAVSLIFNAQNDTADRK
jgi:hypothetical protein